MSVDENNKDLSKRPVPQPPKHPPPDTHPEPAPGAPHPDWPIKESTKRLPDISPKKPFEYEKMPEGTTADSGPPPSEASGTTQPPPTPPSPLIMGAGIKIFIFVIACIAGGIILAQVTNPSSGQTSCVPSAGYVSCGRCSQTRTCWSCPEGSVCQGDVCGEVICCAKSNPYYYNGLCNPGPQNSQQSSGGTSGGTSSQTGSGGVYKGTITIRGEQAAEWCKFDMAFRYTESGNTVQGTFQQNLLRAGECIDQYDNYPANRATTFTLSGTISTVGGNKKLVFPAKSDCDVRWEFTVNANTLSGVMTKKGCEYSSGGYGTIEPPKRSDPFTLTR